MGIEIESERLAYWYLRLNGFFTIENFIVHPDFGSNQETDVDILGTRFPYRAENLQNPMQDADYFTKVQGKLFVAIVEVKRKACALNRSWVKRERCNMQRVLHAIGVFPSSNIERVAQGLYEQGFYSDSSCHVSLLCFGDAVDSNIKKSHPDMPQIIWSDILSFIYSRFKQYRKQKVNHSQWDQDGKNLWNAFEGSCTEDKFIKNICIL